MADQNPSPSWILIVIGALIAVGGLYFGLVGLDLASPPSKINGPLWISVFVGLVFFAGGVAPS